jgi:antitoxin component of MazEF toxin-antitoxin module
MTLPVRFEISVVQVGNNLKITISKEISKHLKLAKGDTVYIYVDNNRMILEEKE